MLAVTAAPFFVLLIHALFPWRGARTVPSLVPAEREGSSESRAEVEQGVRRVGVTHGVTAQVQPCLGVLPRDSQGTGSLNNKKTPGLTQQNCFLSLNPGKEPKRSHLLTVNFTLCSRMWAWPQSLHCTHGLCRKNSFCSRFSCLVCPLIRRRS